MLKTFSILFFSAVSAACCFASPEEKTEATVFQPGPRNWLKNSHLITQALELQKKIVTAYQQVVTAHQESYQPLMVQSRQVLEDFYQRWGQSDSDLAKVMAQIELEIEEKLKALIDKIKKANVDDKATRFVIYDLEEKVNQERDQLAQLDAKAMQTLAMDNLFQEKSQSLTTHILKATELLNEAEELIEAMYENQSYSENEKQYQKVEHLWQSMQAIDQYLSQTAMSSFTQNANLIESSVKELEKMIKDSQANLEKLDATLEEEGRFSFSRQQEQERATTQERELIRKRKPASLWTSIARFITDLWTMLVG